MKRKIRRTIMTLILIVIIIWFWDSYRSSTIELVTIQNIDKKEIKVINLVDRERTIAVSIDMTTFLEVNKQYTIVYDKRLLDKYRLRRILSSSDLEKKVTKTDY